MAILITGANRGIGRGLFDHYRQNGQDVLGTSRDGQAPFLSLDVCDNASQAALSNALGSSPIGLLVCNAGIYLDKTETLTTGYPPRYVGRHLRHECCWCFPDDTNIAAQPSSLRHT